MSKALVIAGVTLTWIVSPCKSRHGVPTLTPGEPSVDITLLQQTEAGETQQGLGWVPRAAIPALIEALSEVESWPIKA